MPHLTIVFDETEDGVREGATSEHFIALWADKDGGAHVTYCVPPEWEDLEHRIQAVLDAWPPYRPVWEWGHAKPVREEPS